jgi:hypothetical protein
MPLFTATAEAQTAPPVDFGAPNPGQPMPQAVPGAAPGSPPPPAPPSTQPAPAPAQ